MTGTFNCISSIKVTKMKFVLGLVFLVSILVAISPQQFHQPRSGQPLWWSQYLHQPQTTETSIDPVINGNTPFFRYSNPIHKMRPTVIYPKIDEEESYRHQEVLDRKQFHSDQNNALIDDQLKRQYLFLIEQLTSGRRQSGDSKIRSGGLIIPVMAGHHSAQPSTTTIPSQMAMPRIKNYGPVRDLLSGNAAEENNAARFFYLDGNNFLSKTVTISVTSTCTSISFVSCIPLASLDPNAPPVNCRRRRRTVETDPDDISSQQQFPAVNPTAVQTVTPTVEPVLPPDSIPNPWIEMTSSKEEEIIAGQQHMMGQPWPIVVPENNQQLPRKGRFLKFNFQSFLTYTTVTILKSIITSTVTQTYLPAAALACLPAGYSICPV
ncbi:hypothetical protein DAPPUDRAFT_240731 [Daphnia pulex]|uniref:Uncharacterized protein n=1 Tax=Daphnia pulex TaxID=6669 RepID=E9GCD3_DAPPU|nr:hypothetical protein DAPPUDRAFT_240731 [Daphnia pulex]|eukprot:EFX82528.1 hypothetical protein DAPPUDRAFT_240731 [Daphnia pulex]